MTHITNIQAVKKGCGHSYINEFGIVWKCKEDEGKLCTGCKPKLEGYLLALKTELGILQRHSGLSNLNKEIKSIEEAIKEGEK